MPKLAGTAQAASGQIRGFDTDTTLDTASAQAFARNYTFCLRYVSLGSTLDSGDLTSTEAHSILAAGLALMPVQHVRYPGWSPDSALGSTDGKNAASHAHAIGFPADVNVWLDLEGIATGTAAAGVAAYANAWYVAVRRAGFVPGVYVGANSILSSEQLYYDLLFRHYWRSASDVPDVMTRGYVMTQTLVPGTVNGISIDLDSAGADNLGSNLQWLAPAT